MSPRATGIITMVASIVLAVAGGWMFSNPWSAIPGALLIVAASISFAVGAIWTLKKSWDDRSWPPDVAIDAAKALRKQRRMAITSCAVAPLIIGCSIALMVFDQAFWPGALTLILGLTNLGSGVGLLRSFAHPPKNTDWRP
ncbi:hypothetical protein [Mycetocola zhujimingii]|uniref:hypothetical protein n=1 Tax=Mycetocola zhujimingii TaxID=2079792 RepID=UPI0011B23C0F|nr:hypothetical protein [Mycetocola zhujimingii]